jgi:hypothetical protein
MTTIPFTPSQTAPFTFQPTLDGDTYNCVVTWNLYRKGYYLNVYDLNANLIVCEALVGSPDGVAIESLSWANGIVTGIAAAPHGLTLGTVTGVIAGASPTAYNGTFPLYVIDTVTFSYPLASDPGTPTAMGAVSYNVNLVGAYFTTSSLVFRQSLQQFEINP